MLLGLPPYLWADITAGVHVLAAPLTVGNVLHQSPKCNSRTCPLCVCTMHTRTAWKGCLHLLPSA